MIQYATDGFWLPVWSYLPVPVIIRGGAEGGVPETEIDLPSMPETLTSELRPITTTKEG